MSLYILFIFCYTDNNMKKMYLLTLGMLLATAGCVPINTIDRSADQATASSTAQILEKPSQAVVPILIYHHIKPLPQATSTDTTFIVTPENFASQMQYLKDNNFATISFKNLLDYFAGQFNLPEKPIIISFDDGVINQYDNAWPILKKYNFIATFFIFTSPIGKSANYMTWEQLKELSAAGMEIGGHGKYHLYLDRISPAELAVETAESKKVMEEKLGIKIIAFAYPFGAYNNKVTQALQNAGYQAVRDIVKGAVHTPSDLHRLKGYFITNNFARFKTIVAPKVINKILKP